ncbi:unnamed protein product [Cylicocyclus nassatus]|uniref:Protein-tyrosine phosphatase n=1 Tax=Cylicocyclus nassatus TaxID=53992 RepID=A0AA36DLC0_CYLNA|nr:unnamed protein product [Cylicocyclus nassatus]
MSKVAKKKGRHRKKAFLQETVEQEEDVPKSPIAQKGGKSPNRKKRQPPPEIAEGLDKFFDYISELGVGGIKKLYNETLSAYRAPDNLYKYAEFEKNKDKNRFLDVVCLDHSRVVLTLDVPPCTNYIHANWVRFDKHDRVFIATQAPLENTREDFWRMVFQEQCSSIINLTSEIDDTDRMVRYFPAKPGDFTNYGKMFVNTKKVEDENKFLVYTVEVLPDGCSNSHLLNLIKPKDDSGKPSTTMILRMLRIVASSEKMTNGPVVVHCVSGVGRAGTVILIDVILQRLFTNQLPVDLAEIFRLLRNQRASCLQREAQFLFVVASVVDYIGTRYPSRYRQKRDKFKEDFKTTVAGNAAKKASREIVKPVEN